MIAITGSTRLYWRMAQAGKAGLALAKELQSLIGRTVKALEAEKQLPQTVEMKVTETVKNPFA